MKMVGSLAAIFVSAMIGGHAIGDTVIIEPDDYANGAVLTQIDPRVTLSTTGTDNVPVPIFEVTATEDPFDYAPTGTRVFGHANIQFFNDGRRLRMDFTSDVRTVSISAAGGDFFDPEVGLMRAYNADGQLLQEVTSAPLVGGESAVLSITRSSADIAFAIAFTPLNQGNFLRLDRLVFEVAGTRPGDIDGDNDVDVQDLAFLLATFGLCDGQQGYAAAADLNGDQCVTLQDLAILLAVFGT